MRGASAVDDLLEQLPDAPLRVHVVWEPVLRTDIAPPTNRVLGLLDDRRVIQYWDPDLVVSADMVRSANENPSRYGLEEAFPPGFVAWDLMAVFGKSARWDKDLPPPAYYEGPVVQAIDGAREAILKELSRSATARP